MSGQLPRERLMTLLAEQYDFLAASSARFDDGFEHEWKRLAVTLRVLLHDNPRGNSHSLLGQLGIKETLRFLDSDAREEPDPGRQVVHPLGWPVGLVGLRGVTGGGWSYFPMLDSDPENTRKWLPFAPWWENPFLGPNEGGTLSRRRDFVLFAANKEGGAHVDPSAPEAWIDLRDGTWDGAGVTIGPDGSQMPISGLVPAIVRQIAHEALTTLTASGLVSELSVESPAASLVIVEESALEIELALRAR